MSVLCSGPVFVLWLREEWAPSPSPAQRPLPVAVPCRCCPTHTLRAAPLCRQLGRSSQPSLLHAYEKGYIAAPSRAELLLLHLQFPQLRTALARASEEVETMRVCFNRLGCEPQKVGGLAVALGTQRYPEPRCFHLSRGNAPGQWGRGGNAV